jgi:hypothetical protein
MATEAQDRYVKYVLGLLSEDEYPSGELMDRLEAMLTEREQVAAYLDVLFDKVESCHYPSKQLLDRISRLSPLV